MSEAIFKNIWDQVIKSLCFGHFHQLLLGHSISEPICQAMRKCRHFSWVPSQRAASTQPREWVTLDSSAQGSLWLSIAPTRLTAITREIPSGDSQLSLGNIQWWYKLFQAAQFGGGLMWNNRWQEHLLSGPTMFLLVVSSFLLQTKAWRLQLEQS